MKNVGENFEKGVEEYKKNAMGEEAYNNAKFDEKFYKSAGYQNILSSSGLSSRYSETQIKQFTQMYLDNGITDAGVIKRALEANINGDEYKQISELGIENRDLNKYSSIRNSHAGLSSSEIAARMQIAKNMPDKMYEDRDLFVRYAKRFGIDESEATSLFDEIDDFA